MDVLYLFKNINFQKGFLLVATLILIATILNIGYKLTNTAAEGTVGWPPVVAPCPDFWDLSGGYCINTNSNNLGNANGDRSIWNAAQVQCGTDTNAIDPYSQNYPVVCNNVQLRTIPTETMYIIKKKNKLVGGGPGEKIKKQSKKLSKKDWANKYGFAWDGLNTKW